MALFDTFNAMAKTRLRKFLESVDMGALTVPSHINYGTAISDRNAVEIIPEDDDTVEAWAGGLAGKVIEGGGTRRRVRLSLNKNDLNWHCTGNPKTHDVFCKHCVAVALFLKR
jgi:uncharacterized Zn finger protein